MIRSILALAAALALAACASPRAASTTLTAADARDAEPAARESAPEAAPAAAPAATAVDAPPGQLVCRTKDAFGVTSEVYLEWSGDGARGVIRSTAPSGMVSERRVHGERTRDSIVLDDPGQTDLVTHAAVLRTQAGKQHVRLADAGDAWSTCD